LFGSKGDFRRRRRGALCRLSVARITADGDAIQAGFVGGGPCRGLSDPWLLVSGVASVLGKVSVGKDKQEQAIHKLGQVLSELTSQAAKLREKAGSFDL
jgi:hypothetical protein